MRILFILFLFSTCFVSAQSNVLKLSGGIELNDFLNNREGYQAQSYNLGLEYAKYLNEGGRVHLDYAIYGGYYENKRTSAVDLTPHYDSSYSLWVMENSILINSKTLSFRLHAGVAYELIKKEKIGLNLGFDIVGRTYISRKSEFLKNEIVESNGMYYATGNVLSDERSHSSLYTEALFAPKVEFVYKFSDRFGVSLLCRQFLGFFDWDESQVNIGLSYSW